MPVHGGQGRGGIRRRDHRGHELRRIRAADRSHDRWTRARHEPAQRLLSLRFRFPEPGRRKNRAPLQPGRQIARRRIEGRPRHEAHRFSAGRGERRGEITRGRIRPAPQGPRTVVVAGMLDEQVEVRGGPARCRAIAGRSDARNHETLRRIPNAESTGRSRSRQGERRRASKSSRRTARACSRSVASPVTRVSSRK